MFSQSNPHSLEKHIKDSTKAIWLESPSNPLLKITDIESITRIARSKKDYSEFQSKIDDFENVDDKMWK